MTRLTRAARSAAIAVLIALVLAAPAAAATPPTRVVHALSPFVIPAGTACAFDIKGEPSWGFSASTTFSDGSVLRSVRAHGAYVNADTGATFPTADNFRELDLFDAATGILSGSAEGQTTSTFLQGDLGPFGVVTDPDGAFYHFVGRITFTYDTNTGVFSVLSYTGTVTDVCAALS